MKIAFSAELLDAHIVVLSELADVVYTFDARAAKAGCPILLYAGL